MSVEKVATLRKDKCLMWEIPLGGFHLSDDALHLSHKVDARLFTWIITRVNTGQKTGVSLSCIAVKVMICCVK